MHPHKDGSFALNGREEGSSKHGTGKQEGRGGETVREQECKLRSSEDTLIIDNKKNTKKLPL